MQGKQGSLSIDSDNIFPIIKKWLYSDQDIFVRELVSNGCDAITKLKKLEMMGEYTFPEDLSFKMRIVVNDKEKTIQFIDNGLGMTVDEVEEYINQIAFSGATDFFEKYKDKTNEDQIIGHFGLGFYSAFMVADKVTIDTLSYKEGAEAVYWECDGGTEFSMKEGSKEEVGTKITLYLNEDCLAYSNEYRVREVLEKYCSFMPTEIYLENATAEPKYETILPEEKLDTDTVIETIVEEAKTEEKENENGEKEIVEVSPATEKLKILKRPEPINDTAPLWTKHPNECSEEEYKTFYRKVFNDYKEPLFWIHLNMDYPFNLKGILYFPQINTEYDSIEGVIKLYNNQVFIADNIKEVIPEFLMLLKGVIDCPDLPLNVSRSALQNDGFVKKISDYITKKVADKLSGMCKVEREEYEKYWDDISPFIKFGFLKDEKFCEKMNDFILFKNMEQKYITLPDCLKVEETAEEADKAEGAPDAENGANTETAADDASNSADNEKDGSSEEKPQKIIYYISDEQQQSQYIAMFKDAGLDAVYLTHNIDQPFIAQLEAKNQNIRFQRIDAELTDTFKDDMNEEKEKSISEYTDALKALFEKALGKENMDVKVEYLKNAATSSVITLSEDSRRMQDMMKMYSMPGMDPSMFGGKGETLVLNANNTLVQYLFKQPESAHAETICKQLYDLALLCHHPLEAEAMSEFVARSNEILNILAKEP